MGKIQPPLARVVRSCMVPFFGELLYLKPFIDETVAYKGFVRFGFRGSICARVIITEARPNYCKPRSPLTDPPRRRTPKSHRLREENSSPTQDITTHSVLDQRLTFSLRRNEITNNKKRGGRTDFSRSTFVAAASAVPEMLLQEAAL